MEQPAVSAFIPASAPRLSRSAVGFAAVAAGVVVLALLHIPGINLVDTPEMELRVVLGAFIVAAIGFFILLQKYISRRSAMLVARAEAGWRGGVLQNAPFGVLA